MEIAVSECVPITDETSVGEARRTSLLTAERLGFDDVKCGEFALLASEAARNVLLHGGGGLTMIIGHKNHRGLVAQILALDKGPGIADLPRAMSDGYSTSGTMGAGLGAMRRIASACEIFSGRDGTVVFLELAQHRHYDLLQAAGITAPYPGEKLCGDAWAQRQTGDRTLIVLADGLGHGMHAADAAREAIETFHRHAETSPAEILSYMHDALRKTRGVAAALAELNTKARTLTYIGVGNICGVVIGPQASRNLVSHNGTLGVGSPRFQEFRFDWPEGGILVMHSDGLQTRWDLSTYPGVLSRHAAVIAGVLMRDFRRQRDDASVVVIKDKS